MAGPLAESRQSPPPAAKNKYINVANMGLMGLELILIKKLIIIAEQHVRNKIGALGGASCDL